MESEASQNSMPVLQAELVTEILSRLPVKSLLKFRCASKSWLALISSSEFVKTHLKLNANNKEYTHHKVLMSESTKYSFRDCSFSSLFNESVTEAKDLDYPTQVPCGVSIVDSVNGLICLATKEKKELFLWNPSIRMYKQLPNPKNTFEHCIARAYGFGYDEFHDDYKVMVIFIITTPRPDFLFQIEAKIYSLKSDSWRTVDSCPCLAPLSLAGKFVNGKLHWATNLDPKQRIKRRIISIDLADEKWEEMEQPPYQEGGRVLSLGALGSDLSVFSNCEGTYMLDVWVMKKYGVKESWTKMFTIKNPENQLVFGSYLGKSCLHMANGSEILVMFGSTFMTYNPKGDALGYSKVINSNNWDEVEIYVESLVCPFSTVGTEDATKMGLKSSNRNNEVTNSNFYN